MASKFVGLAEHVGKGVRDVVFLNEHLLGECKEQVGGEVWLEAHCIECNASSDAVSLKM